MPTPAEVAEAVAHIAQEWREDRKGRQSRRHLEPADFARLRDAGLLQLVAEDRPIPEIVRGISDIYRTLAAGDPSVALVSSMHPAVIAFWLATPDSGQPDWAEQRAAVFASAAAGEQWATITSEPGSGGDIAKTKATATPRTDEEDPGFLPGRPYAVNGDKHFGSGTGIADRMMTTAVADGETDPTIFVMNVRDHPLTLVAEWDGMGMAATQSHAMRLDDAPTVRLAYDGRLDVITRNAGPFVAILFTAVVLGVLDEAVATARAQIAPKAATLRAYEQVEWARAEQDHWLAVQAYEGAVRTIEHGSADEGLHAALRAKQAVAGLAEDTLQRLTRVLGGGTFSQRSPFAHWFEDVRALGFLRPPWGLAYDTLFLTSFLVP
jgi:alkylation response protein AidB-like acyl-CoA dehydrogenase